MLRVLPVIFAILLALTSPAVAIGTGPTTQMPATEPKETAKPPGFDNTTSHLSLGNPVRSGVDTPSVSLSVALEMERNDVRTQKRKYTLHEKLSRGKNNHAKEQLLRRYRFGIESRLSSLKYTERSIRRRYNNGEISEAEYVERLAVLHAKADNIEESIQYMKTRGQSLPRFTPEVWRLRAELIPLQGQVRKHAVDQYRGQSDPRRIYVATTNSGVVLSTIHQDQYVREAYLAANTNSNGTNQLLIQEAQNITVNEYPWIRNSSNRELSTDSRYGTGIFSTTIPHKHGVVKAILDGRSEKIFREVQYKYLDGKNHIPYGEPVRNETENYVLTVNRTYPGGPLRINMTDTNGNPVDGHVSIGDTEIGSTGRDGVLWTVASRQTITVSATRQSKTVNVTVTPYGVSTTNATKGTPQSVFLPSEA